MIMMAIAIAALQIPDADAARLGPVISGRYAEIGADGTSRCADLQNTRSLTLYIRAEAPHGRRIGNIGLVDYRMSADIAGGFTAVGQPVLVSGRLDDAATIQITGGRINAAGRYRYGISDASTVGRAELLVQRDADGDLHILRLVRGPWRSDPLIEIVVDGNLANGETLGRFERCGPVDDPT
jgi:hypothetical protein